MDTTIPTTPVNEPTTPISEPTPTPTPTPVPEIVEEVVVPTPAPEEEVAVVPEEEVVVAPEPEPEEEVAVVPEEEVIVAPAPEPEEEVAVVPEEEVIVAPTPEPEEEVAVVPEEEVIVAPAPEPEEEVAVVPEEEVIVAPTPEPEEEVAVVPEEEVIVAPTPEPEPEVTIPVVTPPVVPDVEVPVVEDEVIEEIPTGGVTENETNGDEAPVVPDAEETLTDEEQSEIDDMQEVLEDTYGVPPAGENPLPVDPNGPNEEAGDENVVDEIFLDTAPIELNEEEAAVVEQKLQNALEYAEDLMHLLKSGGVGLQQLSSEAEDFVSDLRTAVADGAASLSPAAIKEASDTIYGIKNGLSDSALTPSMRETLELTTDAIVREIGGVVDTVVNTQEEGAETTEQPTASIDFTA